MILILFTYYCKTFAQVEQMNQLKQIGILLAGWFFIGLGILGLFLPILQGVLFIMIGLAILSSRSQFIKRFLKHLEERYPHHHARMEKLREKLKNWFKKESG
ncbi:MAG: hypothetical protein A2V86_16225 [Deltaproteobacteria bacterium RBG_16_49_23]|nr:MAG: hypothetical protein A2V86_16225 [Deltaproteobacteria bacterium RBG_16_49_23]